MDNPDIITDPWAFLGVSRTDEPDEIRRQRNVLALATHPDKCPSPTLLPQWTARMASVNDAFVLATDEAAWTAYRRHHHITSVDDDSDSDSADEQQQQQQSQQGASSAPRESARAAHARAHAHASSTPQQTAARRARRAALQARADALAQALAADPDAAAPGAAARWAAYFDQQQRASGSDDPAARVAAREARDGDRAADDRVFGARARVGMALAAADGDVAALLLGPEDGGGGWTEEGLVAESLGHLEEAEEGSHKRRKAARRMLVGDAVERTARERTRWEAEHGGGGGAGNVAVLGGGVERLRIGQGPPARASEADEEMEVLEEDRRRRAQELERYAETKRFRTQWDGRLGNEVPIRKPARPPNRKEARQMKKLQNQGKA